ncbi:hypothetical protein Dsin_031540 [Dipteronia sinensis]|uniref:Uncharacterized protein n=1 Tax=Dipteronia sinensis TaxID=43782 RepID=A0AAD9ZN11_9ROSI|nr:hypothetical protein Dsin_031540 [Dipteronia sinensis]
MATQPSTVKVIDQIQVAPPQGSVSTTIVPLTSFDVIWSTCYPVQRIFFYEFPHPTLHFTQTLLPHLKQSLSQTLRHFFPFAGSLTCPPPPHVPYILFNEGDAAVKVVVTESDADFNHLVVGNHARDVKTLQSLVPKLPSIRPSSSSNATHVAPVLAVQFTVFANSGFSVGVTSNHLAGDGRSINHFMKSWASIHKSQQKGQDLITTSSLSLPYCSKDIIEDSNVIASNILKGIQSIGDSGLSGDVPDDDVHVLITFVLKRDEIEKLKHSVKTTQSKNELDQQIHISSFAVTCAFTWVNLMKLHEQINGSPDDDDDDVVYHFLFPVDCRERVLSEIPATYFGNCLTSILVPVKRSELMGESGIVFAAKAIGRKINEAGKLGAMKGLYLENAIPSIMELSKRSPVVTVASSPKFQVYNTDFGWGRPKKFDLVHIGAYRCFSLAESRDDDGGLDIGIVVERDKMDIFSAIFQQQLHTY